MDGDEPAGDRTTTHDSVHDVFVKKKPNALFVFVLLATEVDLVSFFGRCFTKAFPSHLGESKQIPSVSLHLMCEFFQFSCSSQCPDVPCADCDVVLLVGAPVAYLTPPSWCTTGGVVIGDRAATDPVCDSNWFS